MHPLNFPLNTRIAPSPSGMFHLGTARTAYFNWLAARSTGGEFIVRIDDTNPEANKPEYVDVIFEALEWLGLDYDMTFKQSDRLPQYQKVAEELLECGRAKRTNDGPVLLDFVVVPDGSWKDDIIGDVKISIEDAAKCQGTVLMRSDGTPTYHFASVVDDIYCGINYIIRGQDHVSNTLRQLAIRSAIQTRAGYPAHAHVGLIHKDGKRLSKRDGAASVLEYRDKGYDPDALLNYLLRLGWAPKVDDKNANYIPKERALEMFLFEGKMRPSQANFDQDKLDWLDRKYKFNKGKK